MLQKWAPTQNVLLELLLSSVVLAALKVNYDMLYRNSHGEYVCFYPIFVTSIFKNQLKFLRYIRGNKMTHSLAAGED